MQKHLSAEEQETLFQEILRTIPSVRHPDKLEELALLALSMMVRRADSQSLRDELTREIRALIAEVKPGDTPEQVDTEMRAAAKGCVRILRSAKDRRMPRPPGSRPDETTPRPHAPSANAERRADGRKIKMVIAGAVLLLVLAMAAAWWSGRDEERVGIDPAQIARFIEQVTAAAQGGNAPANHLFGGKLTVGSMGGIPVVTADHVPPSVCAASGMRLVKKGLLGVNGVTPNRVSSAIITELCNKEDEGAVMMWAPNKP